LETGSPRQLKWFDMAFRLVGLMKAAS
jgi:hypothetical protein